MLLTNKILIIADSYVVMQNGVYFSKDNEAIFNDIDIAYSKEILYRD